MTITILPAEEARLQQEAAARGQNADDLAQEMQTELRAEGPVAPYDPAVAIAVLDSFMEQDEAVHKETMAILRRSFEHDCLNAKF